MMIPKSTVKTILKVVEVAIPIVISAITSSETTPKKESK